MDREIRRFLLQLIKDYWRGRAVRPDGSLSRHIPSHVRRLVELRDGRICRYCGVRVVTGDTLSPHQQHLHHVIPFRFFSPGVVESLGTPHAEWNLVVCCQACNLSLGDRIEWPGSPPTRRGALGLVVRSLMGRWLRSL